MAILEALLAWVAGLLLKDLAVPVAENMLGNLVSGKVALPASTLTDAPAQAPLNQELQDDLENQLAQVQSPLAVDGNAAAPGAGAD